MNRQRVEGEMVPCRAALNLVGEHFPCDWPTDENGRHDGWAHANKEAQAIWSSDEGDLGLILVGGLT